jgi:hypothetical protein
MFTFKLWIMGSSDFVANTNISIPVFMSAKQLTIAWMLLSRLQVSIFQDFVFLLGC